MAKKKYTAIHRIMVKAKPPTYIEPKTSFMMEEAEGEKLVGLGAASRGAADAEADAPTKKAPAKKTPAKKAEPEKADDSAEDGDDDLV